MPCTILTRVTWDDDYTFQWMAKPSNLIQTQVSSSEAQPVAHLQATSYICAAESFVRLRAAKPAGRHRVGCLREHAQDQQSSSCILHCWILLPSMVMKQEYEGGWCGHKFCFANNYWMPKTNTDAILAGIAPASVRRNATTLRLALKYALTEHFNNNLVHLKTRPRLKSRRPFAQSAIELMESFAGHESIAQWTQYQWLEEWKKSGAPPHSLPPPKVGNLGLSARRGVNWTTSERESDASGNYYTDGRWHRILGVHAVLEKPKQRSIS